MSETEATPPRSPVDDLLRIAATADKFAEDHPLFVVLSEAAKVCLEDYKCSVKQAHVVQTEMADPFPYPGAVIWRPSHE